MLNRIEPTLFATYMAILIWAPLPFASNRIWGGGLLAILITLVFAAWLLLFAFGKVSVDKSTWQAARVPLLLLCIVQFWVLIQLIPLPRALVAGLSPQAFAWHIKEGWLPLSLDGAATRYYLLRGCTFTAGFFLTLALVNSHHRLRLMLQILVFSGTFQAVYGAFMVLSGMEIGFFVEKYAGQGVATGTFINRNHLAGYLVMCLSAGIGLLLSQLVPQQASSWKERIQQWLELLLSPKIRLRIYLALMVIALVLTRSRMGNVAFFTSLGLAGALLVYTSKGFSPRIVAFLGSLVLVDVLILGRWFGLDKVVERLAQTNPDTEGRVWSNTYTIDYIEKFPITGSGGGSYYGIFPNFHPADLVGYYNHAHNDYLEFAAELGIPATGVLIAVALLALLASSRVLKRRHTALYRGTAFCVCMAVFWAAMHSLADFNLQVPANALTFTSLLALAFIAGSLPGRGNSGVPPGS
ncbi:MAG: O-antigen ligase family protein [Halioglobus sp.]